MAKTAGIGDIRLRWPDGGTTIARRRGPTRPLPVLAEVDLLARFARTATPATTPTRRMPDTRDLAWIGVVSCAPLAVDVVIRWVA